MSAPDIARLRELANAATPGPWTTEDRMAPFGRFLETEVCMVIASDVNVARSDRLDAEYIAAVSPDVVLALLDGREALEAEVAALRVYVSAAEEMHKLIRAPFGPGVNQHYGAHAAWMGFERVSEAHRTTIALRAAVRS